MEKSRYTHSTFSDWKFACNALPLLTKNYPKTTLLSVKDLQLVVQDFCELMVKQLSNAELWVNKKVPSSVFFDASYDAFEPYVQKLEIQPNKVVSFHGDLHGDIHALNAYLEYLQRQGYLDFSNGFKIIDPNFNMVFLGDYTDKGVYGVEVLYTILRLKLANPNKVFMVRGNHEDKELNESLEFGKELEVKFKENAQVVGQAIYSLYNYLPLALYLGSGTKKEMNFIHCCHGGLEVGYNPKQLLAYPQSCAYQLIGQLQRKNAIEKFPKSLQKKITNKIPSNELVNFNSEKPTSPSGYVGFMWNDFIVENGDKQNNVIDYKDRRGWLLGQCLTQHILQSQSTNTAKLRGLFRAHQHRPSVNHKMMQRILGYDCKGAPEDAGVGKLWIKGMQPAGKLWDGIVCTFLMAPGAFKYSGGYVYDAFGLLTTAEKFNDWRLRVVRQDIAIF